ncbi:MAG TPA: hypothetical protein P5028_00660 [Candidatus Marinimicrobia bacterium]|nr:hypothetical protein [Candidatus Neomarinimicrobiota bacterium]
MWDVINRGTGGLACWSEVSGDSLERLFYGCGNVINRGTGGLACWFEVSGDSLERLSYGCGML